MKRESVENEIIASLQIKLAMPKEELSSHQLMEGLECLNNAIDIFEDYGMHAQADQILRIISKIASHSKDPRKVYDPHTRGLTPDKMVKNLLHHGTEFNMSDDGEVLNAEVDLEISEVPELEYDFEDER